MEKLPIELTDHSQDVYSIRHVEHWDGLQGDTHHKPAACFFSKELINHGLPLRVYELGCGTGSLAMHMSETNIEHISVWDRSASMRAHSMRKYNTLTKNKVTWLDPSDTSAIEIQKRSFGGFIAQRIAPDEEECQKIINLAHKLLVPGGILLLSYWVGIKAEQFSRMDWPSVDIDSVGKRICIRFNEWDFWSNSYLNHWRFVCVYIENGQIDAETGMFILPILKDSYVSNVLKTLNMKILDMGTSELHQMAGRILALNH